MCPLLAERGNIYARDSLTFRSNIKSKKGIPLRPTTSHEASLICYTYHHRMCDILPPPGEKHIAQNL